MTTYAFPKGFVWGSATAAYQIEGAYNTDGRGPSVWDTFCSTPGLVHNGESGNVACDHYHRFRDDIKLMADLGLKHYRMSISWTRVMPQGTGAVNDPGFDFYKRMLDCLDEHGIIPWITLFHWDGPQALEDRYGSWRSRQMAHDFADYCTQVVKRLGDRCSRWITLNEVMCFTRLAYVLQGKPMKAPATIVKQQRDIEQTVHHALLAHGLGVQAIRAAAPGAGAGACQVGMADNCDIFVPVTETEADIAAAMKAFRRSNGGILTPMLTGKYDPGYLADLGAQAPQIQAGDEATIGQPLDFVGLNIYTASFVQAAATPTGYQRLPFTPNHPIIKAPWLLIMPEAIYWGARSIGESLNLPQLPIYITENGCAAPDQFATDGQVYDTDRLMYLKAYLRHAQRATAEGYPLAGYFLWSLMDNFEWQDGYDMRFGIHHVNWETQKRTPKLTARWYQQVVAQNRLL